MIRTREEKAVSKPQSPLDHVSEDVRRAIVREVHRLFPYDAHKLHMGGDGTIVFTSNPYTAEGNSNNFTGAPVAAAQMIVLAAANLMRNDEQFVADLAQELAPAQDFERWPMEEPGEIRDVMVNRQGVGWVKETKRFLPPERNPDGSRPWRPSDATPWQQEITAPMVWER